MEKEDGALPSLAALCIQASVLNCGVGALENCYSCLDAAGLHQPAALCSLLTQPTPPRALCTPSMQAVLAGDYWRVQRRQLAVSSSSYSRLSSLAPPAAAGYLRLSMLAESVCCLFPAGAPHTLPPRLLSPMHPLL